MSIASCDSLRRLMLSALSVKLRNPPPQLLLDLWYM
jgi:hypothetical protein